MVSVPRVAVLYSAVEGPMINGARKPPKPGGYQDSGADIAFAIRQHNLAYVITPVSSPDPTRQEDWCFPDTEGGIFAALSKGANTFWANTVVFKAHPLQQCQKLDGFEIDMVGQPPILVEQYDDKNYVNALLREHGSFRMPQCWDIDGRKQEINEFLSEQNLSYPIVGKPCRGRGSHGVKVCADEPALVTHMKNLLSESPIIMLEEYLSGEEGTVTVMPPAPDHPEYWAMPIVLRTGHHEGVAPYNGLVPVLENSRVPGKELLEKDASIAEACRQCVEVAKLLRVTSPIRIDVRREKDIPGAPFVLFDVNMKPNMTGPGRPGRENQASLTAIAAAELGWDYPALLANILKTARPLEELRRVEMPEKLKGRVSSTLP